jgi:hypothetical protein
MPATRPFLSTNGYRVLPAALSSRRLRQIN